ncbi:MAG: hypothetical protein V8R40_03555 [Dysosmobacter sp.]
MKKRMMMVLAAVLALLLTAGCGSTKEETKSVDLTEFYNGLAEEYEWGENYMASIEGDLLESYYPGLGDISTKQFIAMTPQMSSVVNELVFLEAETEEDAEKAAESSKSASTTRRRAARGTRSPWRPGAGDR